MTIHLRILTQEEAAVAVSAVVLASYILPKVVSGEWKRILFCAHSALLSKVSFNEGDSIPGIAHGVVIEHMEV